MPATATAADDSTINAQVTRQKGVRHTEGSATSIADRTRKTIDGKTEYFTPNGMKTDRPQRGLNIIRQRSGNGVKTYKYYQK